VRSSFDIYLRGCVGALLIDDYQNYVTDDTFKKSFDKIREWRELLEVKAQLSDGRPIPVVLCLNKFDHLDAKQSKNLASEDGTTETSNQPT
jgi:GTPase SAR1 family protein